MIGKRLVQAVTYKPSDGDVDVRLTHQFAIMHDAYQQPGQHQTNGNFRIDPRPAIAETIAIGDLLP